ncbi:DNA cytosine methyltransferase [Actinoallomurus iriomotensis]|uniref:DNA (cytosine-5-)-methyltransferase n=1 Tax=Actinoallomurus iriomotensis TaxID=478107 RepID=A0A9W6W165_9ACTN|nr:DNA (cytosine-5-)-methyltransferase [Actinoallomurus iriomotensis]GLY86467.1 DNA cytosine methyltransferase [Actinoallomurus iriomotensis]
MSPSSPGLQPSLWNEQGDSVQTFKVVEICAGAGGQSLGLELAGFEHELAVELDANAANTLRHNRPGWKIAEGDVANPDIWNPADYKGVDLLAGGVPCPPFTIAGKQLGATDERDLFAWAIELCGIMEPRALMLENVRGLSMPRFSAYRQHVLDRLRELGYIGDWQLLHASDYGVPQLRPRFVLVAMKPDDFQYFQWPQKQDQARTVGETLQDLMAEDGWRWASYWAAGANDIAPTIVGGSKKHGGADLGPTRAKRAWDELGVNARVLGNGPPPKGSPKPVKGKQEGFRPTLTCEMVARLQGWNGPDYKWTFTGRKTSNYRQIGNAFPPPVARAIGGQIHRALSHQGDPQPLVELTKTTHDPLYAVLRSASGFLTMDEINRRLEQPLHASVFERHINHLKQDFKIEIEDGKVAAYRLESFKAFVGQEDHLRHEAFIKPNKIS